MGDIEQRLRQAHPLSSQFAIGSRIFLDAAEEIARLRQQLEQAEARVNELESEIEFISGIGSKLTQAATLRKQAEAVEAFLSDLRDKQERQADDFGVAVKRTLVGQGQLEDYAQRLIQQADEIEKGGSHE